MNLFRSEEHVKAWPDYDSISGQSIMPLADWATTFSGPLFRNRLQPDYLSRVHEYGSEMISTLQKFGKTGSFWVPG
jgi:hypothetical protein